MNKILRENPVESRNYIIDTDKFLQAFQQFINDCLSEDPATRPTIEDLLEHEFLDGAANLKPEWKQEYENMKSNPDQTVENEFGQAAG